MFVFGLRAEDVARSRRWATTRACIAEENRQLKRVIAAIAGGEFSPQRRQALSCADRRSAQPGQLYVARRFRQLPPGPGPGRRTCSPGRPTGPSARCSISPAWASSRPTARSPNTGNGSGRFRPDGERATGADVVGPSPRADRMIDDNDIRALLAGRHGDPFAVLGLHADSDGRLWVRALLPGATRFDCSMRRAAASCASCRGATRAASSKARCRRRRKRLRLPAGSALGRRQPPADGGCLLVRAAAARRGTVRAP